MRFRVMVRVRVRVRVRVGVTDKRVSDKKREDVKIDQIRDKNNKRRDSLAYIHRIWNTNIENRK